MKILIKNGRVVDPANKVDEVRDVLTDGPRILRVAKGIKERADTLIDAGGKIVLPGLVDMHVHLREPGREDKETVASGTRAAVKGGVTSLLAMPNTEPAMDSAENVRLLQGLISKQAVSNVYIAGAITKGRLGKELAEIAKLKKEGVIAITDDGASVESEELMLEAFKQAKKAGLVVICHCQERELSPRGAVNAGIVSTRMGLRGISKESEYKRVARDIELAKKSGSLVHIAHISCRESVEIIASAKKKGVKVSADSAPHYFSLTEEAVLGFNTNVKMNPPLRGGDDRVAIRQGLADGTIEAIASDHAPHTENEKEIEFERAEFGVIGLETELAASITELVLPGILDWSGLVQRLALGPAGILKISKGTLGQGADADIIVVDPQKEWVVLKEELVSKSRNCAFLGQKLSGVVEYSLCAGRIVYQR